MRVAESEVVTKSCTYVEICFPQLIRREWLPGKASAPLTSSSANARFWPKG